MIKFPNCKINIGLNVLSKRANGYHNLQTVFYPISINDALEIIENSAAATEVEFSITGTSALQGTNDNLCVKAYHLLKKDFSFLPPVKIHLHKSIPIGAGLGGGSSDAAFTISLLNEKFNLQIGQQELLRYALELGSDCPFFILNEPCFATGRGEELEPVNIDLSRFKIAIVNPGIHISTANSFRNLVAHTQAPDLKSLISTPVESWKESITNDFESSAFRAYPEIAAIKEELYSHGAIYASMSGTGSTVYGFFDREKLPILKYPPHYFFQWV